MSGYQELMATARRNAAALTPQDETAISNKAMEQFAPMSGGLKVTKAIPGLTERVIGQSRQLFSALPNRVAQAKGAGRAALAKMGFLGMNDTPKPAIAQTQSPAIPYNPTYPDLDLYHGVERANPVEQKQDIPTPDKTSTPTPIPPYVEKEYEFDPRAQRAATNAYDTTRNDVNRSMDSAESKNNELWSALTNSSGGRQSALMALGMMGNLASRQQATGTSRANALGTLGVNNQNQQVEAVKQGELLRNEQQKGFMDVRNDIEKKLRDPMFETNKALHEAQTNLYGKQAEAQLSKQEAIQQKNEDRLLAVESTNLERRRAALEKLFASNNYQNATPEARQEMEDKISLDPRYEEYVQGTPKQEATSGPWYKFGFGGKPEILAVQGHIAQKSQGRVPTAMDMITFNQAMNRAAGNEAIQQQLQEEFQRRFGR